MSSTAHRFQVLGMSLNSRSNSPSPAPTRNCPAHGSARSGYDEGIAGRHWPLYYNTPNSVGPINGCCGDCPTLMLTSHEGSICIAVPTHGCIGKHQKNPHGQIYEPICLQFHVPPLCPSTALSNQHVVVAFLHHCFLVQTDFFKGRQIFEVL